MPSPVSALSGLLIDRTAGLRRRSYRRDPPSATDRCLRVSGVLDAHELEEGVAIRIAMSVAISASSLVVGRLAISSVRVREFTQQLSIVAGNREHNRGSAKSAESRAEPKHSHKKSPFEFGLCRFGNASQNCLI